MSYKLTMADFEEFDKAQPQQPQQGGYKLTAQDFKDFDKSQQPQSTMGAVGDYMSKDFQGLMRNLQGIGPWAAKEAAGVPTQLSRMGRGALEAGGKIAAGVPSQALEGLTRYGVVGAMPGSRELANLIKRQAAQAKQTQLLSPQEKESAAGKIGQFIGESIPYAAIPGGELAAAPKFVERAIAGLSPRLQALGRLAGRTGKAAAIGSPVSAIAQPDDMKGGAISGGLIGAATGAILPFLGGAPGTLLRALPRLLGGTHSKEEIKAIMDSAAKAGVSLPLGDVIGSPSLKKFQNYLTNVPLSGMTDAYSKAASGIKDAYGGTLQKMGPADDIGQKLKSSLINMSKDARKESSNLYRARDAHADEIGFKIPTDNFKDQLLKLKDSLKKGGDEITSKAVTGEDNPLARIIESTKKIHSPASTVGGSTSTGLRSASNTQIDKSKFFDLADEAGRKGEKHLAGQYRKLGSSIDKDIVEAYTGADDEILSSLHDRANKHYAENVSPFDDKKVRAFTQGDADADTIIPTFLKTGQYERPELLKKLTSKLTDKERDAVASRYLTKGLKENFSGDLEYSPSKISNAYNKLGPEMKDTLFSPKEKADFDSLSKLTKLMGSNVDQLFTPKTGVQSAQVLGHSVLLPLAAGVMSGDPALIAKGLGLLGGGRATTAGLMSQRLQRGLSKSANRKPRLTDQQRNMLAMLPFLAQGDSSR